MAVDVEVAVDVAASDLPFELRSSSVVVVDTDVEVDAWDHLDAATSEHGDGRDPDVLGGRDRDVEDDHGMDVEGVVGATYCCVCVTWLETRVSTAYAYVVQHVDVCVTVVNSWLRCCTPVAVVVVVGCRGAKVSRGASGVDAAVVVVVGSCGTCVVVDVRGDGDTATHLLHKAHHRHNTHLLHSYAYQHDADSTCCHLVVEASFVVVVVVVADVLVDVVGIGCLDVVVVAVVVVEEHHHHSPDLQTSPSPT